MKQIFEQLSALGVPVHPLRQHDKAPIAERWQINSLLIPTCDDADNIGIRTGATIGMKNHDLYVGVIDLDVPDKISIRWYVDLLKSYFLEQSGGEHEGKHFMYTSHLPFPTTKVVYGLDKNYNFKNVVIAPSFVKSQYMVWDDKHYRFDNETIIKKWQTIISNPISEESWLKLMEDMYHDKPAEERDKAIFIFACIPLIVSEDFNYEFFGKVLSSLATRESFSVNTLCDWTSTLLNTLPAKLRNNQTITKICDYIKATPGRREQFDMPGFPTLEAMLNVQIPIQRGDPDKNKTMHAIIFYKNLFARLFKLSHPPSSNTTTLDSDTVKMYFSTKFTDDKEAGMEFCHEEDFLTAGNIGIFFGEEGTAKSWSVLDTSVGATTGGSFWGDRYNFIAPTRVLYIYGDKSRAIHKSKYISRYVRKCDESQINYIYTLNIYKDFKAIGKEPILFDLSDENTMLFIEQSIKETKSKIVIVDNMSSCIIAGDINDKKFAAKTMLRLKNIAVSNGCCFIMVHHSNKQNTKDTRGKPVLKDDYQGSKSWSALADWTIAVYGAKNKPYEGHVRFRKVGMLSVFEDFDYVINNNKWRDSSGIQQHTVDIEFKSSEENIMLENLNIENHKKEILLIIHNFQPISSNNLRLELGVGKSSEITPSMYKKRITSLRSDGYIISEGSTNLTNYLLTPKGLELLSSIQTDSTSATDAFLNPDNMGVPNA